MFRTALGRTMPLVMVATVILFAVGAALAGNLPFGMQSTVSEVAESVGVDVPMPTSIAPSSFHIEGLDNAPDAQRADEVHATIDVYKAELGAWKVCIKEASSQRRDDLESECGARPQLEVPGPANDDVETIRGNSRKDDTSKSENKDDHSGDDKESKKDKDSEDSEGESRKP